MWGSGERVRLPANVLQDILSCMKLRASRTQDIADVEALVRAGADVAAVLAFLREHEPSHVPAFSRIAQRGLLG